MKRGIYVLFYDWTTTYATVWLLQFVIKNLGVQWYRIPVIFLVSP